MGTYTINYGAKGSRLLAAFGENHQTEINGEPNPETKLDFAKRTLNEMIKNHVINYEARIAQIEARDNSINNNTFETSIT